MPRPVPLEAILTRLAGDPQAVLALAYLLLPLSKADLVIVLIKVLEPVARLPAEAILAQAFDAALRALPPTSCAHAAPFRLGLSLTSRASARTATAAGDPLLSRSCNALLFARASRVTRWRSLSSR